MSRLSIARETSDVAATVFRAEVTQSIIRFTDAARDAGASVLGCIILWTLLNAAWLAAREFGLSANDFADAARLHAEMPDDDEPVLQ